MLDAPDHKPGLLPEPSSFKKLPTGKASLDDELSAMSLEQAQAKYDQALADLMTQDIDSLAAEGDVQGEFKGLNDLVTQYRQLLEDRPDAEYGKEKALKIRARLAGLNINSTGPLSVHGVLGLIDNKIGELKPRLKAIQDPNLEDRKEKIRGTKNAITSLQKLISEELLTPIGGLQQ